LPETDLKNTSLLAVKDLKVYFGQGTRTARAVDGVSFDIHRRETVCLVGESGCGKTVSALAAMGLVPTPPGEIVSGSIHFKGRNLLNMGEDDMQKIRGNHIAMVFQEPLTSLNPVFRVGDQIAEAVAVHQNLDDNDLRHLSIRLLKDVGIASPEKRVDAFPHELSGGQRQRVMIAMALSCEPELVIADEPTTALDVTVQAQILKLFKKLQSTRALSVLYITHDLGVVANIADRIYVMYAGMIVEQGDAHQIFIQPGHPYTMGLLDALPSRARRGKRLHSIPGSVPDPSHKPEGCPFHPRCPHMVETCRRVIPEMCDIGNGHLARCPVLLKSE
jgi:oligopeptide/dipeptide ABC transporter ATP-binding protein